MKFVLERCGPVHFADMEIGDLTLLVGPQASGKSIALQMLKLAVEYPAIKRTLVDYAYDPTRGRNPFVDDYMGEGMSGIWTDDTSVVLDGKGVSYEQIKASRHKNAEHSVFYIPAQRVTTFEDGWPKRFQQYPLSVPFVVREFSEGLFTYLDKAYASDSTGRLFPHPKSLKAYLKESLSESVFRSATISLDRAHARKRLVLKPGKDIELPMTTWSAGQREFTPLLLALYRLLPSSAKGKDDNIHTVIIEEPEMGLHPKAIVSFMLMVMELLFRGYSVIISTHSPGILEIVWALNCLAEHKDKEMAFCRLFGLSRKKMTLEMAHSSVMKKTMVYYFKPERNGSITMNISGLDPEGLDDEADWGGLTEQSTKIADIVAENGGEYAR